MSVLSKHLTEEGTPISTERAGEIENMVNNLSTEKLNDIMYNMLDMTLIFGGDCEELKQTTTEDIKENKYIPNIQKSMIISQFY